MRRLLAILSASIVIGVGLITLFGLLPGSPIAQVTALFIQLVVIVGAVAYGGQDALDIAHVVFGRAVFFVLAIGIYWFAITRPTLRVVYARLREG